MSVPLGTGSILIAPDKFKGSLTAGQVAQAVATGLRRVLTIVDLRCLPVADGGEGTVDAALAAGFQRRQTEVSGPLSKPVTASWAWRDHHGRREAVIELAQASGIELIQPDRTTGRAASSRGTGELLQAALEAGAQRIILGLGGSACTDAGAGMLAALGVRLEDTRGRPIPDGGSGLARVHRIDCSGLDPRWKHTEVMVASDVDNPLTGPNGAAAVFGPQKGLTPDDVTAIDRDIGHFATVLAQAADAAWGSAAGAHVVQCTTAPGSGAAGGTSFAAMAMLGAQRRRGVDVILELTNFAAALDGVSLVITGEGSLDTQTLAGKAPIGIAQTAAARGIPVLAVCGRNQLTEAQLHQAGFRAVHALSNLEPDPEVSMSQAMPLLEAVGEQIGATLVTT
jgi:glycerate kinase